jgi:hypothetical protein
LFPLQQRFSLSTFILLTTLSLFDTFHVGILATERTTFDIASVDTEGSTHLVHLSLLRRSTTMRVGRFELTDVGETGCRHLSVESGAKQRDLFFDGIFIDTVTVRSKISD